MNEIDMQELLNCVAPCSLLCYTCPASQNGAISKYASTLCNYFEGYYEFNDANILEEYHSWLKEFKTFHCKLEKYTKPHCVGCRNNPFPGSGCMEGCVIPSCTKEHNVNFCAECSDFPCKKAKDFYSKINDTIASDWQSGNQRIKEVGIRQYFDEKKDVSHYISYKKLEGGK